jgi:hypothetical protein
MVDFWATTVFQTGRPKLSDKGETMMVMVDSRSNRMVPPLHVRVRMPVVSAGEASPPAANTCDLLRNAGSSGKIINLQYMPI